MIKKFLDLGKQPIANRFLSSSEQFKDEYFFNLEVGFDEDTKLVSLLQQPNKEQMFNNEYPYRSSGSETMRKHFQMIAKDIKEHFDPKLVLEIGSNDGVFLKNFEKIGYRHKAISVEPCSNFAKETRKLGFQTYSEFWNDQTAENILASHGQPDVIYSSNCACHVSDVDDFLRCAKGIITDSGVIIIEDPSMEFVLQDNAYSQFYDEHAHIFSIMSLKNILEKNGLQIFKVETLPYIHGGSKRIFAQKKEKGTQLISLSVYDELARERRLGLDHFSTYEQFAERVEKNKNKIIELLTRYKNENKKIIAYGATSKSTTEFNYCNIESELIDYIVDTTSEKIGKFSPGKHIPIISYEKGWNDSIDVSYLSAWNYKCEIMRKEKEYLLRGGKFILPMGNVEVI